MAANDRWLAEALRALEEHLEKRGLASADSAQLVDALEDSSFPGWLAILASSKSGGEESETGHVVLRKAAAAAAQDPTVQRLNVTAEDIEAALTTTFVHGASPRALWSDPAIRDMVLKVAVEQLGKRAGIPLTPDQAKEGVQLLVTGEFFGDAASAFAVTAFAVRGLPIDLVEDTFKLPHRGALLLVAITQDLAGTPFVPLIVLEDLRDGRLDHPPGVLRKSMACLLRFATAKRAAQAISDLIHPDNKAVRLALVVYARANGIPLEEKDLDLLRSQVFNTPSPDLGPVLVAAVDRYLSTHSQGQLLTALRQMTGPGRA